MVQVGFLHLQLAAKRANVSTIHKVLDLKARKMKDEGTMESS